MITKDDVTIIIPVYNAEKYIADAIMSCLGQAKGIIIIDDASTDNTLNVCADTIDYLTVFEVYPEEKIRIIKLVHNGGTAKALNVGIANSKTDFIKWLSADDILKPNAIEHMLGLVNKSCYQNNRIFYTHYDIINEQGEKIDTFNEPLIETTRENNNKQIATLLDHFYGNGSTTLIHKDIFKKVGLFDESLGYQEDYDFWLRALLLYDVRLTLLPINTIYYRRHKGQLTAKHKGESLRQSQFIRSRILQQAPQYRNGLEFFVNLPLKKRLKRIAQKVLYH